MLDMSKQVEKDFPGKIINNVVGEKKEDCCPYCGYVVKKCICKYKKGMLGGR